MIEIKNKNLLLTAIQILEIRYISFERLISLPYQENNDFKCPKKLPPSGNSKSPNTLLTTKTI